MERIIAGRFFHQERRLALNAMTLPTESLETSSPPARIGNRLQNRCLVDRLKRLGHTLQENAVWMKQFLHGRK